MTASPERDEDFTEILYKYTDLNGATKILSSRTLRFGRPSEMNDPFDVYISDLFGIDVEETLKEARESFFDVLLTDPERYAIATGADLGETFAVSRHIQAATQAERAAIKKRILDDDLWTRDPEYLENRASLEQQRDELVGRFSRYGVFCATRTCSNLLMWAHYADKHKGAVFGFLPDLEKDSFLRLIRPVNYSRERPWLLERPDELIKGGLSPTSIDAGKLLNDRVIHTKSFEWSYEQELRLALADEIKNGESATFNRFYTNELVEVYLGYRMAADSRDAIIRLARALNPAVRIFAAKLAPRRYAMEFDRIGP